MIRSCATLTAVITLGVAGCAARNDEIGTAFISGGDFSDSSTATVTGGDTPSTSDAGITAASLEGSTAARAVALGTPDAAPSTPDGGERDARPRLETGPDTGLDAESAYPCEGASEATCKTTSGCAWTGRACLMQCNWDYPEGCVGTRTCDFVTSDPCGLEELCVPRESLPLRCQTVSPLCGGTPAELCIEGHSHDFSDCEVGDDVPALFCAFSPEGALFAIGSNYQDVLRVPAGWTRSGSYFSSSTLTPEQEARCDALRPYPQPEMCGDAG